jgi:NADPH:quinone reductase
MRAIVINEFGGPEVLRLQDIAAPVPAQDEVLVEVHSVSINRTLDLAVRQGSYPVKVKLPHVLGVDPAGIITHVGAGIDNLSLGDRVAIVSFIACRSCRFCRSDDEAKCLNSRHIGLHRWGGYAQYVAAPARNVFKLPDSMSFADASVITRHFPLAFNLLASKAEVKPGEWVLVMGAAGALGGGPPGSAESACARRSGPARSGSAATAPRPG